MKRPNLFGFLGLALLFAQASFAQPIKEPHNSTQTQPGMYLEIRPFLMQVQKNHDGYKAAEESQESAQLVLHEARTVWRPSLFATAQHTEDHKPSPSFTIADSTVTDTLQVGVSDTVPMGLTGKVYYSISKFRYHNFSALAGALAGKDAEFTQTSPVIELTLPLWRNWWGGETRAQVEAGEATAQQNVHMQSYQMHQVMVQSASAYLNLALARESVRVAKDAVDRNKQLRSWHAERAGNGLGDRGDLLQADAALQTSMIALKVAQDNENTMARAFNMARGQSSTDVPERLIPLNADAVERIQMPQKEKVRDDVVAAMQTSVATRASAEASQQKYKPTLEVYGSLALNNPTPSDNSGAYGDSFNTDRPTETIGVRLTAPLDRGLIHDIQQGYAVQKMAAERTYQRKQLEESNDWNDLVDKFNQAKERSRLNTDLEAKQKTKFDYERTRRSAGRTTTQQVLLFETDYEQSQLARIQSLSDLFQVYASMQLYADNHADPSARDGSQKEVK